MSRPHDDTSQNEVELEPTEDELRQAQALASALERGSAPDELAHDVLEAAALLRISHDPALGAETRDRIWEELDTRWGARSGATGRASADDGGVVLRLRWLWLLVPGLGVAGVLLYLGSVSQTPAASMQLELPVPSQELLRAQANWAGGGEEEQEQFEQRMGQYRAEVYARLEASSR